MKPSAPIAALLASVFALHLGVAVSFARLSPQAGGMQQMAMMQAVPDAAADGASATEAIPSSEEAPCPDEGPCNVPGMPGNCPSVASCAPAISSSFDEVAFNKSLDLEPAVLSSQLPHTPTSPPELPPPRA